MTAFAAGLIAKTGRPLPYDFYHRFINKQYGKWGNEIGRMRAKKQPLRGERASSG